MNAALLLTCLGLSFALSGLEAALLAASMVRARHRAGATDDPRAARVESLLDHRDRVVAAVSTANAAAGIGAFAIVTHWLVRAQGAEGYAWSFALWFPVYLIAFELVPKALFRRFPYRALWAFAPLLRLLDLTVGLPLRLAAPLRRRIGRERAGAAPRLEAFRELAATASDQGALSGPESALVNAVLDARQLSVGEVATPRDRVAAARGGDAAPRWLALARDHGLYCVPVLGEDGTAEAGIDVLAVLRREGGDVPASLTAAAVARPLPEIAAGRRAAVALTELRQRAQPLARVVGADGEYLGVVDAETILAKIFAGVGDGVPR